jgi:hypothetical protein
MPVIAGALVGWTLGGIWGAVRGVGVVGLVFMPLGALVAYALSVRYARPKR